MKCSLEWDKSRTERREIDKEIEGERETEGGSDVR